MLVQSVLTRPEFVSWNETWPFEVIAPSGLLSPSVVHASVNAVPFCSLTVTFSLVAVGA